MLQPSFNSRLSGRKLWRELVVKTLPWLWRLCCFRVPRQSNIVRPWHLGGSSSPPLPPSRLNRHGIGGSDRVTAQVILDRLSEIFSKQVLHRTRQQMGNLHHTLWRESHYSTTFLLYLIYAIWSPLCCQWNRETACDLAVADVAEYSNLQAMVAIRLQNKASMKVLLFRSNLVGTGTCLAQRPSHNVHSKEMGMLEHSAVMAILTWYLSMHVPAHFHCNLILSQTLVPIVMETMTMKPCVPFHHLLRNQAPSFGSLCNGSLFHLCQKKKKEIKLQRTKLGNSWSHWVPLLLDTPVTQSIRLSYVPCTLQY